MRQALAFGTILVLLAGCAHYEVHENLSYHDPSHVTGDVSPDAARAAWFDLYESPGSVGLKNRPAVIAIHGGAWISGDKSEMRPFADTLCPWGYVVLSINYRLAPGAKWPAQLDDCRAAYAYFRAHAQDLGIDPNRIGVLGVSAGAHLAAMLELRDDPRVPDRAGRPSLAIAVDGAYDMFIGDRSQTQYAELMTKLLGHPAPWSHGELGDLSVLPFARHDASILLIQGASDPNVFVVNSDELSQALRAKDADVEYVRLEGEAGKCHGNCWKDPEALEALHRFLDRHLE